MNVYEETLENSVSREEEYLTVEEIAKEWNVSTKTISRWRKLGLQSTTRLIASRNRIVIERRWMEAFMAAHPKKVEKGAKFSQMTPDEKLEIVERAKRMAVVGNKLTEVIQRLSQSTGRSAETIRYTLKNHDAQHPREAIFPKYQRALDDAEKQKLLTAYRKGVPVEELARQFDRTKTSIYRIITETRARWIMELSLEYIQTDEIELVEEQTEEENRILAPMPKNEGKVRKGKLPTGLPSYLASLYAVPLLTFEQEQHLFRKMNYLKFRASRYRKQLDLQHPLSRLMDQIENDYHAATEVKNQLVSANLRLVVSIAKRHTGPTNTLFDLISDGNMSLIRAVEKFDYSRKNRFSTYASWAIMKNYARAISDEQRYRNKFITLENDFNIEMEEKEYDPVEVENQQTRQEKQIASVLRCLTPREQQIIIRRFGLNRDREPLTLKQVGLEMGVTKERIRQIEILAIHKLREAAGTLGKNVG